ncbi:MAG: hypothetical protein QNJ51_00490 [Calothrix sp. MO_167.B12]|nr:hypothetical protein [Calothrix sp. MO_167.B12]
MAPDWWAPQAPTTSVSGASPPLRVSASLLDHIYESYTGQGRSIYETNSSPLLREKNNHDVINMSNLERQIIHQDTILYTTGDRIFNYHHSLTEKSTCS